MKLRHGKFSAKGLFDLGQNEIILFYRGTAMDHLDSLKVRCLFHFTGEIFFTEVNRGASGTFDSAKNHKRQRRKRQSVNEKSRKRRNSYRLG